MSGYHSSPFPRRTSVGVDVGGVMVGGGAPVVVQSMTNTDTADIDQTVAQVATLHKAGSEIVRITVDRDESAAAVPAIRERLDRLGIDVPLVGDFHYIGHKLLADHPACAEALAKYRINPGNVGFKDKKDRQFAAIVEMAIRYGKPVRIGVNWGSLDQELLTSLMDDNQLKGSPLTGLLDESKVTVAGHSAGAGAAYREASADPRVKAFIAYSVGNRPGEKKPPVPKVPGMVMAGTDDGIIPPAASQEIFDGMNPPKYFVSIDGAGHLVFSDICLIGRDQGGLVGLIGEVGLDLPESMTRLASDGCEDGQLDPAKAFPAIDHLSVAFLRYSLGIDPEPVGLDPAVTKNLTDAKVTLTADPG